jgi:hypothetical protein
MFARQNAIAIAGSVDCQVSSDLELLASGGEYPEHCMAGTVGQKKVRETLGKRMWLCTVS